MTAYDTSGLLSRKEPRLVRKESRLVREETRILPGRGHRLIAKFSDTDSLCHALDLKRLLVESHAKAIHARIIATYR